MSSKRIDVTDDLLNVIISDFEGNMQAGTMRFKQIEREVNNVLFIIDLDYSYSIIEKKGGVYISDVFVSGYACSIVQRFELSFDEDYILKYRLRDLEL